MSDHCPDCDHLKRHHSFVGCMADDHDPCDCERQFPEHAKATDPERAEAEKTEAMDRAERGSHAAWVAAADTAVLDLARDARRDGVTFTADDVWALLEERQVPPPREPRALGPVLTRLKRAGKLEGRGYRPSNRRHKAPVMAYAAGPEL